MCTCINIFTNNKNYFGRNMDLDYSFNEKIIITPKNYLIKFKKEKSIKNHFAFIGIGTVIDNYPLYAEACNEKGVCIAGLNFPLNCKYYDFDKNKKNYAPYELVLLIMALCKNMKDIRKMLNNVNVYNKSFSTKVPLTPLHFMISYKGESIVIETLKDGIHIYDNVYNVLTNNPPFEFHKNNITNYLQLHIGTPINMINKDISFTNYSYGQGAFGLPGDYNSSSRFIKTYFVKNNILLNNDEYYNINQFFKCLESVLMPCGTVKASYGLEYTRYTCCIDAKKIVYYYKTYNNSTIHFIDMKKENLNSSELITYNLIDKITIIKQN